VKQATASQTISTHQAKSIKGFVRDSAIDPTSGMVRKRFISDVEIQTVYGIPRKTLQNWRSRGVGPVFKKFGSAVRYDVRALETYLDELPTGGAGVPSSALRSRKST
jgi:hypothetical protein